MLKTLLFIFFMVSVGVIDAQELSPQEFDKIVAGSDTVQLLDVRTFDEYQTGYIYNALQADWTNKEQFTERVAALDKSKPVYIYCLSGGRSASAQAWMLQNGFTSVTNLKGGINAWNKAKLPLTVTTKAALPFDLESELKNYSKNEKVLVDVSAYYCPPCKKMQPIIEELKTEKYPVVVIDGGVQKQICEAYSVEAFPTFIVFQNGKEIARKQGIVTKEALLELLK